MVSLFAAPSTAADLHVPIPYTSIQSAIDAAVPGDTVYLQPGVYKENINLSGKNITIRNFNTYFDAIIDGGAAGPVVTFSGKETDKCTLRDLVLRNGKAANGAGILGNATMATIRDCTIGGNVASGSGGGIYGVSGSVRKCIITLNQAANGGGVAECDGMIDACSISLNKASATGGGVYNCAGIVQFSQVLKNEAETAGGGVDTCNGFLIGNLIDGNMTNAVGPANTPASFGGGVANGSGFIIANTITNNLSGGDGGGIANFNGFLQNSVIASNGARRGGGIASCNGLVENCTIWGNTAVTLGGGVYEPGSAVSNSIIFSNTAPNSAQWSGAAVPTFSCVQNWTGGQADIITMDPMLKNPAKGDYHLMPGSPCIDAGKFLMWMTFDFDVDLRPYSGVPEFRGDGSDIDIGADEFIPTNIDAAIGITSADVKYKGTYPKLNTQVKANAVIANTGTETIAGQFYVQFYLSNDATWQTTDYPIGKAVKAKGLKPGKTKTVKCSAKLPVNVPATGLYLIAVADPANSIGESNSANNIAVYGPLP